MRDLLLGLGAGESEFFFMDLLWADRQYNLIKIKYSRHPITIIRLTDNSFLLLHGRSGEAGGRVGSFDFLHPASYFLHFAHNCEGIGPEAEIVIPLGKREGLVSGAIFLLDLPVFESEGKLLFVEAEHHVVELVVFSAEVVSILGDCIVFEQFEVGLLVGGWVLEVVLDDF